MSQERKIKQRLKDLERRMAALEAGSAAEAPAPPAGAFWALEGLKQAEPQPAVVYAGVVDAAGTGPVEWQMGHAAQDLLDADWSVAAGALSALGHPARLAMLRLVLRGEASTAADLAARDDMGSSGQVYHHLRQLVAAGWLRAGGRGAHQVPPERVVPLLVVLGAAGV
jgi:hypothetical protein